MDWKGLIAKVKGRFQEVKIDDKLNRFLINEVEALTSWCYLPYYWRVSRYNQNCAVTLEKYS